MYRIICGSLPFSSWRVRPARRSDGRVRRKRKSTGADSGKSQPAAFDCSLSLTIRLHAFSILEFSFHTFVCSTVHARGRDATSHERNIIRIYAYVYIIHIRRNDPRRYVSREHDNLAEGIRRRHID